MPWSAKADREDGQRTPCLLFGENLLYKYQCGFRKDRSTTDHIASLANDIRQALNNRESLVGVFLDIHKAYDSVWKEGLLYKIHKLGINGRMFWWTHDFLSNRTFQVRVDQALSSVFPMVNGIPRGSCLSPTLFNILIDDVASSSVPQQDISICG